MASLQNSIPVHAITPRRHGDGSVCKPMPASSSRSPASSDSGTSSTIRFCCTVVRTRRDPTRSAALATSTRIEPDTRPAIGLAPTK